jgi:hypothetical protein
MTSQVVVIKGFEELSVRFNKLGFITQQKTVRTAMHFGMLPSIKAIRLGGRTGDTKRRSGRTDNLLYSAYSAKWFGKSFIKAWRVHGFKDRMPTVLARVKRKNKVAYKIGKTNIYESSAYTMYWHNDGTKNRYTKKGKFTGRIKGNKFATMAIKLNRENNIRRFALKMKKALDKI